jgi:hypothetical protein
MNTKLIAAVLIAASTAIAAPAFARGGSGGSGGSGGHGGHGGGSTGPAGPVGYDWGATAQGQQVQKAWAERHGAGNANTAYGGSDSTGAQSGAPSPVAEGH